MNAINPLFLDSTKPIGNKVVTNVELFNLNLRDGETVYFEVTDQFGFVQRFALKCLETKKSVRYAAEVWLKYQHEIQYRFMIVSEGEEILSSGAKEARAGHIISESWEPCLNYKASQPKKSGRSSPRANAGRDPKAAPEIKTNAAKSLVKPQFFDQIKSLIEDLM